MHFEYDLMFHYLLASLCSADGANSVTSTGVKLLNIWLDGDSTGECILLFHSDDVTADVFLQVCFASIIAGKALGQVILKFPPTSDDDVDFLLDKKVRV
jgi:hypothetical protein